jgi:transcriptional antiterminator
MEKFSTRDRRHAIAQLLELNPDTTNAVLAKRYGVSERTVSNDRAKLREDETREANPLADLKRAYRCNMERLKQAKTEIKEGTRLYLDHVVTEFKLTMDYLKALQALGVVPKNVGGEQILRWDFVSPVAGLLNMKKSHS